MSDVTRILNQTRQGDPVAAEQLLPLVYEELRILARQRLANEKPGQTLQATALVHEAYLRLIGKENDKSWDNRGHFFAAAAEAMRRILVENARRKGRLKREGKMQQVTDEIEIEVLGPSTDVLAIDEALQKLAQKYPDTAELVKLRFFAGMTVQEVAEIQGISISSCDRHWAFARAWMQRELVPE